MTSENKENKGNGGMVNCSSCGQLHRFSSSYKGTTSRCFACRGKSKRNKVLAFPTDYCRKCYNYQRNCSCPKECSVCSTYHGLGECPKDIDKCRFCNEEMTRDLAKGHCEEKTIKWKDAEIYIESQLKELFQRIRWLEDSSKDTSSEHGSYINE